MLSEQWADFVVGQGWKAGCVPFGFRYAKHSDEPKAESRYSLAGICSLKVVSIGNAVSTL